MHRSHKISKEVLAQRIAALGFPLPDAQLTDLETYLALLVKWNKAMNLVGTPSWEDALETLVIDSFHIANFLPQLDLAPSPICFDLGSGAGLPGIPLRMLWQAGTYTLVEAREKRALFMRTVLASLDLGTTTVFQGRAENFFPNSPPADFIVSRAFMPWRDMLNFVEDAVAPCGRVLFLTLTEAPEHIPAPWSLAAQTTYLVRKTTRHLWCFVKN